MRILHWTPVYRPYIGGMEVFLSRLAPALAKRGHEVRVITGHGYMDLPDHERLEGIELDRFRFTEALIGPAPAEILRISREVTRIRSEFAPDIVHLHFSDASTFFYLRTIEAHPAPTALTFHVHPPEQTHRTDGMILACIRGVDRVSACSQATLDIVTTMAPEVTERARVIRYGLPVPKAEAGPLSFEPPVVATAGRLVPEKGFDVLVEAAPALRERHPGLRIVVAGDGPEIDGLRAQVRRLGVEDCVELLGWVEPEEIHALFGSATVIAVPSVWQEPFGLVAVQAGLAARPAVITAVGGLPEAADEDAAVQVQPGDPRALAEAISGLIIDPARAQRMGDSARSRAVREFGFERSVNDHEGLYQEMLA